MKLPTLFLAALLAFPAHAGGQVIIEDTAEAAPRDRSAIPLIIIGALIVGGLLAGGDNCYAPDDVPEPEKGGC